MFENLYNRYHNDIPELKPILCKSCHDDNQNIGTCESCMLNRAFNKEWMETHLFVTSTDFDEYHSGYHDEFKCLKLRLPNEHPYLYYGIEVEVEFDDGWNVNCDCDSILEKFSQITNGMFVYEHDGSLENGIELISRPTSYAFWTHPDTVKKLEKGFEYLKDNGALIHQPTGNGLHIHLSKKFFDCGEGEVKGIEAHRNFEWLFLKFQTEIEKIGGRKWTCYCRNKLKEMTDELRYIGHHRYSGDAEIKMKVKVKKGQGEIPDSNHSYAVIYSGPTLEARMFHSTIDYREVLSYIELVRNFAYVAREKDIKKSLDNILHTKENLYLDEHLQRVRMACEKQKVAKPNLGKVNDDEINMEVSNTR